MLLRFVLVAILINCNCKNARAIKPSRQTRPPGGLNTRGTLGEEAIEPQQNGLHESNSHGDEAVGGRDAEKPVMGEEVLTEDEADPTPRKLSSFGRAVGMNGDGGDSSDSSGPVAEADSLMQMTDGDVAFSLEKDASSTSLHNDIQLPEGATDEDKLKALWLNMMEGPPSPEELKCAVNKLGKRDTNRKSMYHHLLAQLSYPLNLHAPRTMWLDPEFALNLKGLAVMTLQPELCLSGSVVNEEGDITYKSNTLLQTGSKAIRLSAPTGTHFIQIALAKSLAHSCNASVVALDSSTIEQIKSRALELDVKRGRALSTRNIFKQLFEAVKEANGPVVVLLQGRPKWLFENGRKSEDLLHTMLEELDNKLNRLFFVMTQPNNSIRAAQEGREKGKGVGDRVGEIEGVVPPSGPAFGGSAATSSQAQGSTTHLVARIIFRNGSACLGISSGKPLPHPLPPSDDGAPDNANPHFRMPPPQLMKKILAEQQRHMRGPSFVNFNDEARFKELFPVEMGHVPLPNVPIFNPPPNSSEEDIFEAMRTPENTGIMNGFLDHLMHTIFKNIPLAPEAMPNPEDEPRPIPAGIEIISHQGPSMEKYLEIKFHLLAPTNLLQGIPPPDPASMGGDGGSGGQMDMSNFLPPDPLGPGGPGAAFSGEAEVNPQAPYRMPNMRWGLRRDGPHREGRGSENGVGESAPMGAVSRRALGLFEEVVMESPKEQTLRNTWDSMVADEVKGRVARFNTKQLRKQLQRAGLKVVDQALERLAAKLGTNMLTAEEVTLVINYAAKLQAGGVDCVGVEINGEATNGDSSILQYWALDLAVSNAMKLTHSHFGRPVAHRKNELMDRNFDKYEKALVSNIIAPQELGVSYDMIGGLDSAKESLRQCITYPLKYPWLYSEGIAQEAVKGVLLFGPPGTGKTMLAKAVATEGGATFLTVDAGTIENKWLGESEKNAKAVFTLARQIAPCVVYLDEVDSILSSREQGDDSSHGTLTSVKTTLMQEWDGLRTTNDRVVVIASTNRPFDLDEAVLRRLPRRILVDLPDLKTRQEIMEVTLANNRLAKDVNLTTIATQLEGYSGSDIKEVCREAVVRVCHERAVQLEKGGIKEGEGTDIRASFADMISDNEDTLRAVSTADFKYAMTKLKASVNDSGRELQKVIEWNSKYGETKNKQRSRRDVAMQMYI